MNQHRIKDELIWILGFILCIWIVFILDRFLPLENLGLRPRSLMGLTGIASISFLHQDLGHITANTVPLITLLALLAGSRSNSIITTISIAIVGATLLWLFGRGNSIHIGASLLVFGLIGFLLLSGVFEKRFIPIAISIFVLFTFGGALLSGIVPKAGVSWDGHLFGAIGGIIVAWFESKRY